MFFVSLSGYDETLEEEPDTNGLQDSLQAFTQVANNAFLEKTNFILILNKKDIFMKRITVTDLNSCFPDYKGKKTAEDSLRYIEQQFERSMPGNKQLYIHQTCAVDVKPMKPVLGAVMDRILNINTTRAQLQ